MRHFKLNPQNPAASVFGKCIQLQHLLRYLITREYFPNFKELIFRFEFRLRYFLSLSKKTLLNRGGSVYLNSLLG